MDTLQKRLKIARVTAGMTQKQLAEKADVSRATIAMLETDEGRDVRGETLVKIATALQVTPGELLGMVEHAN
jgi:transcriptional regulator with XRE-family HTH domain